jgi:hypothetical protein
MDGQLCESTLVDKVIAILINCDIYGSRLMPFDAANVTPTALK